MARILVVAGKLQLALHFVLDGLVFHGEASKEALTYITI